MKPVAIALYAVLLCSAKAQITLTPPGTISIQPLPGAEMISSGPQNLLVSDFSFQPLEVDLNRDGITDISFDSYFFITTDYPSSGGGGSILVNSLGNYILSDGNYVAPSSMIYPIGSLPARSWQKGSFSIGYCSVNYLNNTSIWSGPWANLDIGYFSVLFKDADDRLYSANIRLFVPEDSRMEIYIMDWYYSRQPIPEPACTGISAQSSGSALHLSFSVRNGLQYALEHCTNLLSDVWCTNSVLTATSDTLSTTNDINSPSGYWRLKTVP